MHDGAEEFVVVPVVLGVEQALVEAVLAEAAIMEALTASALLALPLEEVPAAEPPAETLPTEEVPVVAVVAGEAPSFEALASPVAGIPVHVASAVAGPVMGILTITHNANQTHHRAYDKAYYNAYYASHNNLANNPAKTRKQIDNVAIRLHAMGINNYAVAPNGQRVYRPTLRGNIRG